MRDRSRRKDHGLDRRSFLRWGAAGVVLAGTSRATNSPRKLGAGQPVLPRRRFGKGPELPVLGYGGAALVARWGNPLSVRERVELVRHAYERGIRYFDTAGNYGESQRILGVALRDVRQDVFLVTKVETTEPALVRPAVERSLQEFHTDYLDGVLIHGSPGLEQMTVAQAMEIHAQLARLRDEGIVRSIGFSAHSQFDKALALIESGGFDHCLLPYGFCLRTHGRPCLRHVWTMRDACIARAHERRMGIAVMKVLGSGVLGAFAGSIVPDFAAERIEQLPRAAIRHVLADLRVAVLVIGMRFRHEIDSNIRAVRPENQYDEQDRAVLSEFWARARDNPLMRRMWAY